MLDSLSKLWSYITGSNSSDPYMQNGVMQTPATNSLASLPAGMPQYASSNYGKALAEQQAMTSGLQSGALKLDNNGNVVQNNAGAGAGLLGNMGAVVQMGTSLFNAWNALQARKQQQQALDLAKRNFMFNVNAYNQNGALSTKMYNQALTDKYLGRYSYAGKSESDAKNQADKDKLTWNTIGG